MAAEQIRSPMIRALYTKWNHQEKHKRNPHTEWYAIIPRRFPTELRDVFLQLKQDEGTEQFLANCYEKSDWFFTHIYHAIAKAILTWFMTSTSINGLLQRGSMFVLSSDQFRQLLDIEVGTRFSALLDIGAGDGNVTEQMASFFDRVYVTELSNIMQRCLAKRGFTVLAADEWSNRDSDGTYDVVSCLNVLDRCAEPITMLSDIAKVLKPDTGRLLLGLVLPVSQYVETSVNTEASEMLDLSANGNSWEAQMKSLVYGTLAPAGYRVLRWTRVPYLCEGDFSLSFYRLNEVVLLLGLA